MKAITQLDIAKAIGVSQTTVGLVVGSTRNEKKLSKLSQDTIERIRAKAEEMGYRPHRHAQVMRTGKSMQVGVIYSQTHLQVAVERISCTASVLQEYQYDPIFFDAQWHSGDVRAAINYLTGAKVAGIILLTGYSKPEEIEYLSALKVPIVGMSVFQLGDRPEVRCDMRDGFLRIFRHFAEQGCRRIAVVAASEPPLESLGKWAWQQETQVQGVRDGAAERCWDFDIVPLRDYAAWAKRTDRLGGPGAAAVICSSREVVNLRQLNIFDPYSAPILLARHLIESGAGLPDAILFPNDEWAYGFACEAMRHGFRIPEDIAIAGFNDSSLGQAFTIPLTSARQPISAMARKTVELMIKEMEGDFSHRGAHYLPSELVIRKSSLRFPENL